MAKAVQGKECLAPEEDKPELGLESGAATFPFLAKYHGG